MGMGGNGNVESHSRTSLLYSIELVCTFRHDTVGVRGYFFCAGDSHVVFVKIFTSAFLTAVVISFARCWCCSRVHPSLRQTSRVITSLISLVHSERILFQLSMADLTQVAGPWHRPIEFILAHLIQQKFDKSIKFCTGEKRPPGIFGT